MFRRCVNSALLTAFAAVSLLGHGGLHLLPGGHDCHGHHHAAAHTHADHSHGHACHHGHAHHADHSHPPAPQQHHEHEHDDCLVCQWHAQGQLAPVSVVIPQQECCRVDAVLAAAQVTTSFRLSALTTRGPPA